jgi:hypothetical protein
MNIISTNGFVPKTKYKNVLSCLVGQISMIIFFYLVFDCKS